MSAEAWEVLRGMGLVALASGLLGYGIVRAADGRTHRRIRLAWAALRGAIRGDRQPLIDAYLRGVEDGTRTARYAALRESGTREADLIARAYSLGWNASARSRGEELPPC